MANMFDGVSYDFVGDICILNSDDERACEDAAQALMKSNKGIKGVVARVGEREGEFRLQRYKHILGERRFETVHKENGVKISVDISKAYFSPRLGSERMRVAKSIKKGDRVLVMFCGVGAYNLIIGKHAPATEIVGVEKNPAAFEYCRKNRLLNNLFDLKFYCGDVRDVKLKGKYDRVLMPLPKNASDFLDVAVRYLAKNGVVYFYDFVRDGKDEEVWKRVEGRIGAVKRLRLVYCGAYSPGKYRVCAEFSLAKGL